MDSFISKTDHKTMGCKGKDKRGGLREGLISNWGGEMQLFEFKPFESFGRRRVREGKR